MTYPADVHVAHLIEAEHLHRIRRTTFERMIDAGMFPADQRIELLDGVMVAMSPQSDAHATTVVRLNKLLVQRLGDRADVAPQLPYRASSYSRPEPDVALWPPTRARIPGPGQLLLAIEVADSTLRKDREIKAPIYAAARVPEYWIINLADDLLERHTAPGPRGYRRRAALTRDDRVRLVAFPDVELAVADILAPLRRRRAGGRTRRH